MVALPQNEAGGLTRGVLAGHLPILCQTEKVCLINVDGAIGPATANYISRGVDEANRKCAQCLIIQLNTPGGLLDSTRAIVQKLLTSPVPVVVYVAPTGATAASAGCFITLSANVAAMAPANHHRSCASGCPWRSARRCRIQARPNDDPEA